MTLIVASLVEKSVSGILDSSRKAFSIGADLVEVRIDHLDSLSEATIREARRAAQGPAIAALRSRRQGGKCDLKDEDREKKMRQVVDSDFEYVDFELGTDDRILARVLEEDIRPVTIASRHFMKPVGRSRIEKTLLDACKAGDIGKVAMPCEHAGHAIMLAQVGSSLAKSRKKYVLIGMGEQGQLTRVCADQVGSELAYACLPGKEAAPGQLDLVTQSKMLKSEKLLVGLLGHPVSHSVSRPMQEAAIERAGLVGAYLPFDFPPDELDRRALKTLRELGFVGLNVTIPHKEWAFGICSRKGPAAIATKAVNTLTLGRNSVVGENTDVTGFARLIDGKIVVLRNLKCLLVGAGGAARAAVYVLTERGARVTVTDIEMKKARKLAREFKCKAVPPGSFYRDKQEFSLIVNCTPVGMKGVSEKSSVKEYLLGPGTVFIDIVFNPLETAAMKVAKSRGATAYGGLEMLVQQGAESFRLWTEKEPDIETMRQAARRALE